MPLDLTDYQFGTPSPPPISPRTYFVKHYTSPSHDANYDGLLRALNHIGIAQNRPSSRTSQLCTWTGEAGGSICFEGRVDLCFQIEQEVGRQKKAM